MRLLYLTLLFLFCLYPCSSAATNSISVHSPASSSSRHWRQRSDTIGDDAPHEPPGNEPLVPYIKTVPTALVDEERFPSDRLKLGDPVYTAYIAAKKYPAGRSAFVQLLVRKLSRPNFTQNNSESLENWLKLKGASIWDVVRILESPNFDGLQLEYLNELPRFYLKQRMLVPFTAFLKRFQYGDESADLFNDKYSSDSKSAFSDRSSLFKDKRGPSDEGNFKMQSTPFTRLVFSFLEPKYLEDPSVDPFFTCLVQTQPEAFESCEWMFLDAWIRSGTQAWRFLKLYFEHSHSPSKSRSLVTLLTASDYSGPITADLMKLIVSFESFDPNIHVHYFDNKTQEKSAFFHILVLDPKYSTTFLPQLLKCESLDTSVPTGTVVLSYKACEIVYTNQPILYLAGALGNGWALFHLSTDQRITAAIRTRDFLLFLFLHFLKIFWLSFLSILRELYAKVRTTP